MTNIYSVGDRVRVTDVHTTIGGAKRGEPGSFVGATGRVAQVLGSQTYRVDFDDESLSPHGSWSQDALERTPDVGDRITTRADWNTLPLGAVVTDQDGWIHTKIADGADVDNGEEAVFTSTFVDPEGGDTGTFYAPWDHGATLSSLPKTPADPTARPAVDFSGPSRTTARMYAVDLKSDSHTRNATLGDVARGEKVDALTLNEALFEIVRSFAGRGGDRTASARKAAHLQHIAQAVLENHVDQLPAYAEGQRSRKIETLEGEVAALKTSGQHALDEVEATTEILRRLQRESAETEAQLAEAQRQVAGLTDDLTRHVALREFVEAHLLDEGQRDQVIGFTHGWSSAQRA